VERFASDLQDPSVEAIVDRDLALAESLDLPGAPSVLLCGYFVGADRDEVLDNLDYLVDR